MVVIESSIHKLRVLLIVSDSLPEVYIERIIEEEKMWWLFIAEDTIYMYFYVTHFLKYRENDWRKNKRCGGYS